MEGGRLLEEIRYVKTLIFRQNAKLVKCNVRDMAEQEYLQDFTNERYYYVGTDQCLKRGEKIPRQSSGLLELIKCGGDGDGDDNNNVIKVCSPLQNGAFFDGVKFGGEEEDAQKIAVLSADVPNAHSASFQRYFDFVILQFREGPKSDKYIVLQNGSNETGDVCIDATEDHFEATKFVFTAWYIWQSLFYPSSKSTNQPSISTQHSS